MKFQVSVILSLYFLFLYSTEANAQTTQTTSDKVVNKNNELNEVVIKKQTQLVKYSSNGTIEVMWPIHCFRQVVP
jgi:hypothetical protein